MSLQHYGRPLAGLAGKRLKVSNETVWRTDDLRRLMRAACKVTGAEAKGKRLRACYSRGHRVSGWGQYPHPIFGTQGQEVVLRLPRPERCHDHHEVLIEAARVLEHELAHCLGVKHRDMRDDVRRCCQPVPWAEELRLRSKA